MNSGTVHTGRDDMVKNARAWVAGAGVLGCASVAYGNAGSGMAMAVGMHLVLGNLVIGIVEGIGAAIVFRVNVAIAMLVLVVANYLSAWVGFFAVGWTHEWLIDTLAEYRVDAVLPALYAAMVLSFLLSVLIEFPAFLFLGRWKGRSPRAAVLACVLINVPTNAAVWAYYAAASDISLLTETSRAQPPAMLADAPAFDLYFLSRDGAAIEHAEWDGETWTLLPPPKLDAPPELIADGFLPDPLPFAPGDAAVRCEALVTAESAFLVERVALLAAEGSGPVFRWLMPGMGGDDPTDDSALLYLGSMWWDYRAPGDDAWHPHVIGGQDWLGIRDRSKKWIARLGLSTPAMQWNFGRVLALPGDVLITEIAGQIIAIHIPTMRMAPLARGSSPVILLRDPQTTP